MLVEEHQVPSTFNTGKAIDDAVHILAEGLRTARASVVLDDDRGAGGAQRNLPPSGHMRLEAAPHSWLEGPPPLPVFPRSEQLRLRSHSAVHGLTSRQAGTRCPSRPCQAVLPAVLETGKIDAKHVKLGLVGGSSLQRLPPSRSPRPCCGRCRRLPHPQTWSGGARAPPNAGNRAHQGGEQPALQTVPRDPRRGQRQRPASWQMPLRRGRQLDGTLAGQHGHAGKQLLL
mmetsp:Transcript_107919/g.343993  ORF Transcript_107919/g.343993 Transcript_107919/m.343993 type:complete len:229 (-) Transcript_107919:22-708(-)